MGVEPLPRLVQAAKTIAVFPGWAGPEEETGYTWFDAPLEIGGVTERAFILHGGCYYDRPDCHVTFELRIGRIAGRRCLPLIRVDWRSINGGHTNPRRVGSQWSGRTLPETHLHPFDLNYSKDAKRMRRGNLRMAIPIADTLQSFLNVRDFVGKQFGINNIHIVTEPGWDYKLPLGE